jgi:VWFA-related protein
MLGALTGSGPLLKARRGQDPPAAQAPRPTFRVEANLVRVDAIVTKDGRPVRDLGQAEVEVLEDGVLQTLTSFEMVDINETRLTALPKREPATVAESRAAAEDPRSRVFVLFLDRYHTGIAGSHRMQSSLTKLLERVIGPDDLIAVMTPDMSASDVAFTRRTGPISDMLARNWTWGVRDQRTQLDPEEEMYLACFPDYVAPGATTPPVSRDPQQPAGTPAGMFEGDRAPVKPVAREMIDRRREKRTLDALNDLAVHLRGIREERKAVVIISDGWALYRPDERLARLRSGERAPGVGIPGTDPTGRIVSDAPRSRTSTGGSQYECDVARQQLSMVDNRQAYMDLMQTANRANVSFYPVDSRGLAVFDTDLGETFVTAAGGQSSLAPNVDQRMLSNRIQTLETLAANTDGIAVVNSNDIDRGLQRVVADLSTYYLMSYYSTNTALDGKYRTIIVRVKRPGVDVRARKGYRAATTAEMATPTSAAAAAPANTAVQAAFSQLGAARADLPLRSHVAWLTASGKGRVFASVELDPRTQRQPDWAGVWRTEFTLTDAKGSTVLARATVEAIGVPPSRAEAVLTPEAGLEAGDYQLRARLTPTQGLALTDSIRFTVPADPPPVGSPWFARRNATTGRAFVRTSDLRFRRTDWLRVVLPLAAPATVVSAELVDQRGQTMSLPVSGSVSREGETEIAVMELSLAPLAAGEYAVKGVVEVGGARHERLVAFRVVTS